MINIIILIQTPPSIALLYNTETERDVGNEKCFLIKNLNINYFLVKLNFENWLLIINWRVF